MKDATHLQTMVEKYGAEEVWYRGIDVLGYPPSWNVGIGIALKLQKALEERDS